MQIILAIISGLTTALIFPTVFGSVYLPNMGFLAWVSLVPLFSSLNGVTPRRAFLLTFITAIIYYGISLCWLYNALTVYGHLGSFISIGVIVLMIVILASYIALAPMTAVWIERRLGISYYWTIPIFWVVFEFARNSVPCNGFPWGNITNSQYAYLPLIQIVDLVGIYGLTYVMVALNCGIVCLLRRRMAVAIYAFALLAATFAYGWFRLNDIKMQQEFWPSARVALIQGNAPQEEKWQRGLEELQIGYYRKYMHRLDQKNIDLVVWPESTFPWLISDGTVNIEAGRFGWETKTDRNNPFLLFGGLVTKSAEGGNLLWNSAFLINRNGSVLGRYDKMHLVPFGEYVPYKKWLFFADRLVAPVGDFQAGKRAEPLSLPRFKIAPLVCYEDVFPEISREFTQNGANLLVNITNDAWYGRSGAAFQHLAISVFRAVEDRRWMVRSANSGVSAVVDAAGQILVRTDIFEEGVAVSQVKLSNDISIYVKYKDYFAWTCMLFGGCLIMAALFRKKCERGSGLAGPSERGDSPA